jgi:hypothetical protein
MYSSSFAALIGSAGAERYQNDIFLSPVRNLSVIISHHKPTIQSLRLFSEAICLHWRSFFLHLNRKYCIFYKGFQESLRNGQGKGGGGIWRTDRESDGSMAVSLYTPSSIGERQGVYRRVCAYNPWLRVGVRVWEGMETPGGFVCMFAYCGDPDPSRLPWFSPPSLIGEGKPSLHP